MNYSMHIPPERGAYENIDRLTRRGTEAAGEIAILAVANVKENESMSVFDRDVEYFTENELDEIVNAFRTAGFYCEVFIGEQEFISWVSGGGPRHFPKHRLYVYNTSQTGCGAGRKSLVPAFCAFHGIATLNSDPYAVSLARHKFHVNAILRAIGIPVPSTWWYLGNRKWFNNNRPDAGTHILAKSTYESSSIGISEGSAFIADHDLEERLEVVSKGLNQPIVVQRFIVGREAETPVIVLPEEPLPLGPVGISVGGRQDLGESFLSCERVYKGEFGFYSLLDEHSSTARAVQFAAARTVQVLQLRGFSRVDVRINEDGQAFVTDVATTPHLIAHSSYMFAFDRLGFDQSQMITALVGASL